MNVTLVMVQSLDGKTTHPSHHLWSSVEDQTHFEALKEKYTAIIMGRKTYDTIKNSLQYTPKILRVVMTKHQKRHEHHMNAGQLEFTNESPQLLLHRLARLGHVRALLVGGSEINTMFLREKLISDCYITVEPRLLGEGKGIFTNSSLDIPLKLLDVTRLNPRGTLLLHYTIDYEYPTN